MSTLLQTCPECSRSLELPADALGRMAKCPACEATFRIGQADSKESPADNAESANAMPEDSVPASSLKLNEIAIEDVIAATWSIFRSQWKPSALSCLIVFIAALVLVGIPMWVISSMANGGQTLLAAIGVMLMVPYVLLLGAYAVIGVCRVHLAIARGEADPLQQWKSPTELVFRFLPSYILVFLMVAVVVGAGVGVVAVTAASGQPQLTRLIGVVVSFAVMVVVTALQWSLWAWMMAASDGKCTALGSLKIASSITQRNRLASFFIVIIALVLSLVGSLACYVGHIVTLPLTLLLFAVGYLMATNQPVADPADG